MFRAFVRGSGWRVAVIGVVGVLAACSGNVASPPLSSTTPVTGASSQDGPVSATGASPQGGPAPESGTTTTVTSSTVPVAGPSLVVAQVAAQADLARALGASMSTIEDDGGVFLGSEFVSQARVATAASTLTVLLDTYPSSDAATAAYSQVAQAADPSAPPAPAVGDAAAFTTGGLLVRKGAQVLTIRTQLSAAAEKTLEAGKASGNQDDAAATAARAAADHDATGLAKAVGARLDGKPVTQEVSYLPAGATDPCDIDPSPFAADGITVSSQPTVSDRLPGSECILTLTADNGQAGQPGTGRLSVYTLTSAQATASVKPTTPADEFTAFVTSRQSSGANMQTAGTGAVQIAVATHGELALALLLTPPSQPANLRGAPSARKVGPYLIVVDEQGSSYVLDKKTCDELDNELGIWASTYFKTEVGSLWTAGSATFKTLCRKLTAGT